MYEIPFFLFSSSPFFFLNYVFIVITTIVITVNLVSRELVILMGKNGFVHEYLYNPNYQKIELNNW